MPEPANTEMQITGPPGAEPTGKEARRGSPPEAVTVVPLSSLATGLAELPLPVTANRALVILLRMLDVHAWRHGRERAPPPTRVGAPLGSRRRLAVLIRPTSASKHAESATRAARYQP